MNSSNNIKIAYVAFLDVSNESGVLKKLQNQISFWSNSSAEVRLYILSPSNEIWADVNKLDIEIYSYSGKLSRLYAVSKMSKQISTWNPDLIYFRQGTFYPNFLQLLKRYPTVTEINTYDVEENKLMLPYYKYTYHRIFRKYLLDNVHGTVFMTNELRNLYKTSCRSVVISNGINLSDYKQLDATVNAYPRLVFLGSPGFPWQGVDKVVTLANYFNKWSFDIIGPSIEELNCRNLPKNITVHGYMNKKDYVNIIKKSDIAIGTLGLHRKKMDEACTLKLREYMAWGIPSIIGYKDSDFNNTHEFILELPNIEENITDHFNEIEEFVYKWKGKRIEKNKINHIDIMYKERLRLDFFKSILNSR